MAVSPGAGGDAREEQPTVDVTPAASSERSASADDPTAGIGEGSELGRYLVLGHLGAGGMGVVVRAHDPELSRVVALKLMRTDGHRGGSVATAEAQARLVREAQAMAQVSHPNVIEVFDVGLLEGSVFVAMELVEGPTLGDWQRRGQHWKAVLSAYVEAGRGLVAAHAQGLIHRDFKPSNVLVGDDGRIRVLDFGLARAADASEASSEAARPGLSSGVSHSGASDRLTEAGVVMGTPAYMAPEQAEGITSPASDQYSFCLALYEALYGERPFAGRGDALLDAKRAGAVPPAPRGSAVPRWLRQVVLRGLSSRPAERWPDMEVLLERLERTPGRRRLFAGATVLAVVGLGGSAFALVAAPENRPGCEASDDRLAAVWNRRSRQSIEDAIARTGVSYADQTRDRTLAGVDHFAEAWADQHADACTAAEDPGELDLRMACLRGQLASMRAITDVLGEVDETTVRRAHAIVRGLPDPVDCGDVDALRGEAPPPSDTQAAARVEALSAEISRGRGLIEAGRPADALEVLLPAMEEAEALGFAPMQLSARHWLAITYNAQGKSAEAEREMRQVFFEAREAGKDVEAMNAALKMIYLVGYQQYRSEEAETWVRHARVVVDRLPRPSEAAARLEATLGNLEVRRRNLEQALEHHQAAMRIWTEVLDPEHDAFALAHNNIGNMHIEMQQYDEARKHLEQSLAIAERTFGDRHPRYAQTMSNLAVLDSNQGRNEEARRRYEQVLPTLVEAYGEVHPTIGGVESNIGDAARRSGDCEGATPHYLRSEAILDKALGSDHPNLAYALHGGGLCLVELGRHEEAIPRLERALQIRESLGDGVTPAQARFALARALRALGRDPDRARALAENALASFVERDSPDDADIRRAIEAFLGQTTR